MTPRFLSIAYASRRVHARASMGISPIGSGGILDHAVLHVLK